MRKNIFQLVEENYSIQDEIRKINGLFTDEDYFSIGARNDTLESIIEDYLFNKWKYKGTCISLKEYFSRVNADVLNAKVNIDESIIVNNLEVMENFVKLYLDNSDDLYNSYKIQYYTNFTSVFCELIHTLEKKMGLTTREYKDRIVIYPKSAPLEKVIDLCDDEDVQWELIRYEREDLTLAEKRKSLAFLATNLYIENDSNEQNEHIKSLIKQAGNILNNLHIRHNNKTGKWENTTITELNDDDAISLCDMVYNEMLTIVLLREHKEYEKAYSIFTKKQKKSKSKKQ